MAVAALADYGMSKVHRSTLVEYIKPVQLRMSFGLSDGYNRHGYRRWRNIAA